MENRNRKKKNWKKRKDIELKEEKEKGIYRRERGILEWGSGRSNNYKRKRRGLRRKD